MENEVDVHVGRRIRHRRWLIGMTQMELAELVGVKYQQVQKYEAGANRVSASRLWMISNAQRVNPTYYFKDLDVSQCTELDAEVLDLGHMFEDQEVLKLVRICNRLPANRRARLVSLAKAIAAG